jgi:pimeloyl-ACP methyl ester carboxylesterase
LPDLTSGFVISYLDSGGFPLAAGPPRSLDLFRGRVMKKSLLYKNGNSLAYAEYGDQNGNPVLIQHGLIASINDYPLFDLLIESGAHLICPARPGYGASSPYVMKNIAEWADIVSVLVEELGLTRFDVLGISSGAPYSYAIGHKFQDRAANLFILSGTPALYNEKVLSYWPYEVKKNASIEEMQKLAYEVFFSGLSPDDLEKDEIRDSMMNDCFGIAQDLRLRCMDWGFQLQDVKARVTMRHSKADESVPFVTAELTAELLPNCCFDVREKDVHFSKEVLDDFIITAILPRINKSNGNSSEYVR